MAKRQTRAAAVSGASNACVVSTSNDAEPQRRVSTRVRAKKEVTVERAEDVGDIADTPPPTPKRKRRVKADEPVVYEIPPVEKKTTTWHGRLGFACLNTVLRTMKPVPVFCSRTCRIDTIKKNGLDFVKDLGLQNARDLLELIKWNENNNIQFMRVSSDLFPFASHKQYGYSLEYASAELKAVGDLAKTLGHRLTTHPGQFTQLGSPKDDVVAASVRELQYHVSMFELMGIGRDGVIIIHMGGVYGDKQTALDRFKSNYVQLPQSIKDRLVLENDEICYNVDDLLPISEELNIPIVFDYHHDWIYPSSEPPERLLPRINAVWHAKGIHPKQHLSSPRPGARTIMQRRAHAARCDTLPAALDVEGAGWWRGSDGTKQFVDLMVEAKDKEQAVFELYRIYDLADTVWDNLRPAKIDPGFEEGDGVTLPKKRKRKTGDSGEDSNHSSDDCPASAVEASSGSAAVASITDVTMAQATSRRQRRAQSRAKGLAQKMS